jgi:hypothetical protein
MANLLGMNIIQFLGMQAMWILMMAVSSMVKRRKRSVEEDMEEVGFKDYLE